MDMTEAADVGVSLNARSQAGQQAVCNQHQNDWTAEAWYVWLSVTARLGRTSCNQATLS